MASGDNGTWPYDQTSASAHNADVAMAEDQLEEFHLALRWRVTKSCECALSAGTSLAPGTLLRTMHVVHKWAQTIVLRLESRWG